MLAQAGGKAIELKDGEDVNEVIHREFPEAKRIASYLEEISCATFKPDMLENPKELNDTDVAVVRGKFGVVENAAVWLPKQVRHKGLYFIANAMVILLDKTQLVNNMHETRKVGMTMECSCLALRRRQILNRHWCSVLMVLFKCLSSCYNLVQQ